MISKTQPALQQLIGSGQRTNGQLQLSWEASHFAMPDWTVLLQYLELFESPDIYAGIWYQMLSSLRQPSVIFTSTQPQGGKSKGVFL
jgi:hypothetical protein